MRPGRENCRKGMLYPWILGKGTWAKPTGELQHVDHTSDCHNEKKGGQCIDTPCTYQLSIRAAARGYTFPDNSSSEYTGRIVFSQWLQEIRTIVFHSLGKKTEAQTGWPNKFPATIQSGLLESECDPGNFRVCLLTHSFRQCSILSHK